MSLKFKIGESISNEDIVAAFKCSPQGGMRRSLAENALVIIANHTKGLYDDKWYGDEFHYTGMGKRGDQQLSRQNWTLAYSKDKNIEVHLFEVFDDTKWNKFIYQGLVELVGVPYQEDQLDEKNKLRKVYMFPLKLLNKDSAVDFHLINKCNEKKEIKARKYSKSALENLIKIKQKNKASYRTLQNTKYYVRNPLIVAYAKKRANGKCQLCGNYAPFRDKYGEPYLEVHHVIWLSQGGEDSIENTVALCPNCHRKMHILQNEQDIEHLKKCNEGVIYER